MLRKATLVESGNVIEGSIEKLLEGDLRKKAFDAFNNYCSRKVKTY